MKASAPTASPPGGVRGVLRKHGYLPDKTEQATLTVIEQAEAIAKDWAG